MSWLNTIKDHLVEADPDPTPQLNVVQPITKSDTGIPVASLVTQPNPILSGNYQNAVVAPTQIPPDGFLTKLRSKLSGDVVDKLEATLGSLAAIPDIGTRLNAAVSVLKSTMNIDVHTLSDAYTARLNTLELQCGQFATALGAQSNSEITARENSIKLIGQDIESKSNEIKNLVAQRETLSAELVIAKTKLAGAQAGFEGAVATLKQEITDSINQLRTVKQ